MDSNANADVLFQIRWVPVDHNPPQPDDSPSNFDTAVSHLNLWNTDSTLSGMPESAAFNEFSTTHRDAQVELFQQPASTPAYTFLDPQHIESVLEPGPTGLNVLPTSSDLWKLSDGLGIHHTAHSADPWSPLNRLGIHHTARSADPWSPLDGFTYPSTQTAYSRSRYAGSIMDTFSTFYTARSDLFSELFHSAISSVGGRGTAMLETLSQCVEFYIIQLNMSDLASIFRNTEYFGMLRKNLLWPVDPYEEQNWSGRGQHVELKTSEIRRVDELLVVKGVLGQGNAVVVHSVKCGRILLARKTIYTNKNFTKDQAVSEVAHLSRLKHSHIVRLIGTYVWKTALSILMYPVADRNLESFLENLRKRSGDKAPLTNMTSPDDKAPLTDLASSCLGFFSCLSSAFRYIHVNLTKHLDVKPQNILVRTTWHYRGGGHSGYVSKVYISDFGISRSYQSEDAINTDGAVSFTKKYASPEVAQQLPRGLPSDIFSLGCVFLEIFATLDEVKVRQPPNSRDSALKGLQEIRSTSQSSFKMHDEVQNLLRSNQNSNSSYQGNLIPLQELLKAKMSDYKGASVLSSKTLDVILKMIQFDPKKRLTADGLVREFGEKACCKTGPEELEAERKKSNYDGEQSPNGTTPDEFFYQSNEAGSDLERAISADHMTEHAISGLSDSLFFSTILHGGFEERLVNQNRLVSHMWLSDQQSEGVLTRDLPVNNLGKSAIRS